ncbi:MAG: hypothetical protein DMG72_20300 [Acidobacteria bacterium]|nr:MAG: hypothetical protein DMG72_20300 [Acidobacteriota bacterium]
MAEASLKHQNKRNERNSRITILLGKKLMESSSCRIKRAGEERTIPQKVRADALTITIWREESSRSRPRLH